MGGVAYLIPPMTDEPPRTYLEFVAARADLLRAEAARLTGGNAPAGDAIAMEVLSDLAAHWRRLGWLTRLRHHDARADYLRRRLLNRTRQWRDEQPYPVEVLPSAASRPPDHRACPSPGVSVALRLAALLPTTVRSQTATTADAEIAWAHAYRRFIWRRWTRICLGVVLLLYYMIHFMEQASAGAY